MILFYIITVIIIILGFKFKDSKKFYRVQMIWMWILMALNTGGADWNTHLQIFNANSNYSLTLEKLITGGSFYSIICQLFHKLNLNFFTVNLFLSSIGILIFNYVIKKYSKNKCITTSLLYIYPLVECIIQKRNFIASAFIILAFSQLIESNDKKAYLKFIFYCFIAAQFHIAAWIYLLFLPFMLLSLKKLKIIIPTIFSIGIFLIPMIPKIASKLFAADKVELYFYILKINLIDSICWILFHIAFIFIAYLFYKRKKAMENAEEDIKTTNFYEKVFKINLISLIFSLLYFYEPTFIRIFRNILIFNFLAYSNLEIKNKKMAIHSIQIYQVVLNIIAFLLVYVVTGYGFDYLVHPLFENNLLFSFLSNL